MVANCDYCSLIFRLQMLFFVVVVKDFLLLAFVAALIFF